MLIVEDLNIEFPVNTSLLRPVQHVSFKVNKGETLGIVGESGCGKSLTSLALMDLLPTQAILTAKKLTFLGKDLLTLSPKEKRLLKGSQMSMIFQDPMSALNPSFTIGFQIEEVLKTHLKLSRKECHEESLKLLEKVGISDAPTRLKLYPHQISGGMAQRVMIAMSMASKPKLLIADEPTTALDVTIQAQIMGLLRQLQNEYQMGLILISHNLGLVAQNADRIQIMYAGEIVECGKTEDVLNHPRHPYTKGLIASLPENNAHNFDHLKHHRLPNIKGMVPDLQSRPQGCQFHPRCPYTQDLCKQIHPLVDIHSEDAQHHRDHLVRCFFPLKGHQQGHQV